MSKRIIRKPGNTPKLPMSGSLKNGNRKNPEKRSKEYKIFALEISN
ncbi:MULTISPECIES: hypothetical protein [Methanobacterium]|jgi:hypothetical protein|uniref:Uncharacterized protein n=1 Tax=Methanobacterium subterraneum TaxID=59277 RepID=A0A7K4DKP7_9EURY|nr:MULTISPECIES: hypothetical protein [Methanobacterium]MBW4256310.1 hypothetical protein [Methanobacterium sp. YSL]NMO09002.1 hypothetical protein [Methanobacterium subterraneum]